MFEIVQLKVINGGKVDSDSAQGASSLREDRMSTRFPSHIVRLGDVAISGECLRICCGTCGHLETKSPHDIAAPLDLPLAEVRRMLACTACGGRWVDVKRTAPNVVSLRGRRRG